MNEINETKQIISDIDETLSQYLEKDVQTDGICKQLLSDKYIIANILSVVVKRLQGIDLQHIARCCIEESLYQSSSDPPPRITGLNAEDSSSGGKTIKDLLFFATIPEGDGNKKQKILVNIEPQGNFYPGYPLGIRALFYASSMITSQKGTIFSNSDYNQILAVYGIWILLNPPKYMQNTIQTYKMAPDIQTGKKPCAALDPSDYMHIAFLCLGDKDKTDDKLLRLLDTIFSTDTPTEEKCRILDGEYHIPLSADFKGVLSRMTNIGAAYVKLGLEQGIEKGIEKGIEQGIEQGIEKGKLELIRSYMAASHTSAEQALEALYIPEEQRSEFIKLLEQSDKDA